LDFFNDKPCGRSLLGNEMLNLKFASPCIIRHFKYINQPDATVSQVYYLTFMYSSTCFGRPHPRYQELNNCSSSLWFYRWSVVVAVLLVVFGPAGPVFAGFTLAFALQLRKKHGKTLVRVAIHKHTIRIHSHNNKNT